MAVQAAAARDQDPARRPRASLGRDGAAAAQDDCFLAEGLAEPPVRGESSEDGSVFVSGFLGDP